MSEPNEETEIKQDIKVLVCSQRRNFVLYLAPNSTFKDLLLLIENKTQWIHDYKFVTFKICTTNKVVKKSDLNFRLEELDIQDSDAIQANISNKKLENSISLEDLEDQTNPNKNMEQIKKQIADVDLVHSDAISVNISNKKLENSIVLEDLEDKTNPNKNMEQIKKEIGHGNQSWSLPRKIFGVFDLILLLAAIITFLLNIHIAVPIVLTALCVAVTILFFGWNTILPKILPKGCLEKPDLGTNFDEKDNNKTKKIENNKENSPTEEEKKRQPVIIKI